MRACEEERTHGGRLLACELDVAEDESVAAAIAVTVDTFGGLDGLLAHAAELSGSIKAGDSNVRDMHMESFDETRRVNPPGRGLRVPRNSVVYGQAGETGQEMGLNGCRVMARWIKLSAQL